MGLAIDQVEHLLESNDKAIGQIKPEDVTVVRPRDSGIAWAQE